MRKPSMQNRRFIEWSKFHGCPVLVEKEDGVWELFKGKTFDWKRFNYKIDNKSHEDYYGRLYVHGMN